MSLKGTKSHIHKVKVRYSEIDCQRIVYNSHYLTYFDISISELLDDVFNQDRYIKETNNEFHTVAVQMNFKAPARLNDQLEVYSSIKKIGNSSLMFYQEIYKEGSDELLNSAEIVWVHTNQTEMKASTIPEDLRKKFDKYLIN
tara:strand:- start:606 stop:1034 length:429 start_codon:yes stop_codon:yes gene_type:complete